jgi:sortase (surface protein transpeptidase)
LSVEPRRPVDRATPTRIVIDSIGVDHPVRPVGIEPDGQLEIPDETEVGWYRLNSAPGERGAAVFAGHVSWNGSDGPFVGLALLEPGSTVRLELADGSSRTYAVVERAQDPKQGLPADRIWTRTGPETLVLITCGGEFNWDTHRYYDNVVVYARPVA